MARRGVGVRELIELSEGAFVLPDEVVSAYDTFIKVQQVGIGEVNVLDVESAAHQLVTAVQRGESPNALDLGRDVQAGTTDQRSYGIGTQVLAEARELAAAQAESVVIDMADRIIREHLAPAFEELMAEASEIAPRLVDAPFLNGDSVDLDAMARDDQATRNARQAWRQLELLARRRRCIIDARYRVNMISHRTPQKDTENYFVGLRHPERLQQPGWKPGSGWQWARPSERQQQHPTLTLLWWIVDAAPGVPWLPSTTAQDERWEEVFGQWRRERQQQATSGQWARLIGN